MRVNVYACLNECVLLQLFVTLLERWSGGRVQRRQSLRRLFAKSPPRAPAAAAAPACTVSAPSPRVVWTAAETSILVQAMGSYISGEQGRYCAADIGTGVREALCRFTSIQIYEKSKYLRKRFVQL